MRIRAYIPTRNYTRSRWSLPEYTPIYASPEAALHAGEILWRQGARYLVVIETDLEQPFSRWFETDGRLFCRRDNLQVIKVRAARP